MLADGTKPLPPLNPAAYCDAHRARGRAGRLVARDQKRLTLLHALHAGWMVDGASTATADEVVSPGEAMPGPTEPTCAADARRGVTGRRTAVGDENSDPD